MDEQSDAFTAEATRRNGVARQNVGRASRDFNREEE
ncbi:hypothetical protein FB004_115167 [Sinorhizobium medicae]|nr:hypothetical protein FB004_115167 [Sinorhizobium medicae]